MISTLRGKLTRKTPTNIIVECNGVGYQVNISMNTLEKLPELEKEVFLETELVVREDSQTLYGFSSIEEKNSFNLLIGVSGIGPKSAIGILSGISFKDLRNAILTKNIPLLTKLPGIGKKTAERLILELKDKFDKLENETLVTADSKESDMIKEAELALVSLGYSKSISDKSVNKAAKELKDSDYTSEILIKKALKYTLS